MLEVVVLPVLGVKDMNNDVAVVQGYPLPFGPTLFAQWGATPEANHPLDLLGNCSNLPIVSTRDNDEQVKGVNEFTAMQHHRLFCQLVGRPLEGHFGEGEGVGRYGPRWKREGRLNASQRTTKRVTKANTNGRVKLMTPTAPQR